MGQEVQNAVKRKAMVNICERPRKIIHNELAEGDVDKNGRNISLMKDDFNSIQRGVYTACRKLQPRKPRNVHEVHKYMEMVNIKNLDVLLNDSQQNIIILSSAENLRALCEQTTTIYIDGTFKQSTKYFTQFFTIHGLINRYYH